MKKYATVPAEEFINLKNDSNFLSYLESGGVDNWEWYGDSTEDYEELTVDDLEDSNITISETVARTADFERTVTLTN